MLSKPQSHLQMNTVPTVLTPHWSSSDQQPHPLRIGIVGAGTSGLYLAILLKKQGYDVTLFEQAPQPKAEGCGIMLVAAGMQALFTGHPQLCDAIVKAGVPAQTFEFRNLKDKIVNFQALSYQQNNELTGTLVHRGAILNALLAHLPPDCLQTHAQLQGIHQTQTQVIAFFADHPPWRGDLLVGADGIFSTVRDTILQTGNQTQLFRGCRVARHRTRYSVLLGRQFQGLRAQSRHLCQLL